jgi:hypothetical protein
VRRNSFQSGELVSAESQNVLQVGRNFGPTTGNQGSQLCVERAALPQNAGRQLMHQAAIRLREPAHFSVKCGFEWFSLSNQSEDGQRRAARFDTRRAGH